MTSNIRSHIVDHILDLRRKLLPVAVLFCVFLWLGYTHAERIFAIITLPLMGQRLIFTSLQQGFSLHVTLAGHFAILCTIPLLVAQLYRFALPGLFGREKAFVAVMAALSVLLFATGVFASYYLVMPLAWEFFLSYNGRFGGIEFLLSATEYISLFITLCLGFGLAFQVPVIIAVLVKLGVIKKPWLAKRRREFYVLAFIIGAIVTPPDVFSQIIVASSMIALFELTLLAI